MYKILVIEDNELIRDNIEELLELSNYRVVTASNGQKGLVQIQTELPDLILCDIDMPKMNGYQFLEHVKSNPKTAIIPFVFITSSAQKEDIEKGLISGADSYLTKPFTIEDLTTTLEKCLK